MTFTKVNQKPLLTGRVQLHVMFACRLGEYTQYIYIYIFIYIDTHICIYILLVVCDKPPRHVTNTGISLWDADTHFRMWEAGKSRECIFLTFFALRYYVFCSRPHLKQEELGNDAQHCRFFSDSVVITQSLAPSKPGTLNAPNFKQHFVAHTDT